MNNIEKLLGQMVDHRKRVVMQVSGVPAQALLAVGYGDNTSHLDIGEDLRKPAAMVSWIEERAKQSTLLGVLYESMTPWGRERKRIEAEQLRMAQEKSKKLNEAEILERDLIIDVVAWTDQDKSTLDSVDTELIENLVSKGYFDRIPEIINRPLDLFEGSPSAITPMGTQGIVRMNSDRMGDFFSAFPKGTQKRAQVARNWAEGGAPDEQSHIRNVYMRWFILFHEITHCMYGHPSTPFDPTPGMLDEDTIDLVNRWVVGSLGTSGVVARDLLNENHSDVYAIMLLLEMTDHDPIAMEVVAEVLESRIRGQDRTDGELIEQRNNMEKGKMPDPHCTCWALKRALEDVEKWKGAPPDKLREMARRYASDGLVDLIDPKRTLVGKMVGQLTLERIVPGPLDPKDMTKLMVMMTYSYSLNGQPEKWLQEQDKSHPIHPLVSQSWNELLPKLRKLLAQDLKEERYPGATVADAVRRNLPEGIEKVADLIKATSLPINDIKSEAYQSVNAKSEQAGRELLARIERQMGIPKTATKPKTKINTWEFGSQSEHEKSQVNGLKP